MAVITANSSAPAANGRSAVDRHDRQAQVQQLVFRKLLAHALVHLVLDTSRGDERERFGPLERGALARRRPGSRRSARRAHRRIIRANPVTLTIGSRLGPYEILSPLGAGGMGEVYKAKDTRLHRTVAIKVLPRELTSDSAAKQRLDREGALAVSARGYSGKRRGAGVFRRGGQCVVVREPARSH
jgi:hypothetical protein